MARVVRLVEDPTPETPLRGKGYPTDGTPWEQWTTSQKTRFYAANRQEATKRLIAAHNEEFRGYLQEGLDKERGVEDKVTITRAEYDHYLTLRDAQERRRLAGRTGAAKRYGHKS